MAVGDQWEFNENLLSLSKRGITCGQELFIYSISPNEWC